MREARSNGPSLPIGCRVLGVVHWLSFLACIFAPMLLMNDYAARQSDTCRTYQDTRYGHEHLVLLKRQTRKKQKQYLVGVILIE